MSVRVICSNEPGAVSPLYGAVNPPVIEGFTIFPRPNAWLVATDGKTHFFVCSNDWSWALFECAYEEKFRHPRSNPDGVHMKNALPNGLKTTDADFLIDRSRFTEPAFA